MSNYYDRVLEDFDLREGVLDEGIYDEGSYDEGVYDEGAYDEAVFNRKKRPVRIPSSVGRSANFANSISPNGSAHKNFVTKSELRNSLNGISSQVNDLKKSSISLASSLKRLDEGYDRVVKSIAKKDKSQDSLANNTMMTSLISTMINKPSLNTSALEVVRDADNKESIRVKEGQDAIQVDLMKTVVMGMLPKLMNPGPGGSDNSMGLVLPMLLLTQKPGTSSNDMMPLMLVALLSNKS